MASTALDFREMMRKERERAMKQRTTTTSASKARCALGDRSHATVVRATSKEHEVLLPLTAPEVTVMLPSALPCASSMFKANHSASFLQGR